MESLLLILVIFILAEVTFLTAQSSGQSRLYKDAAPIFVDTSVLIDGRVLMVARAGFLMGRVCIPRSVVGELQYMADHSDSEKRSRARFGLDMITQLQAVPGLKIEVFRDSSRADEGVDDRLLYLAKKYNGSVCTIDYNLNKVAAVEGIPVLNINDLALGLRMAYLPGEKVMLELTTKGQDQHQAVGHLMDGTMVVVERANNLIGKTVEVEFIRSLQTAAGKMMFAKLTSDKVRSNPVQVERLKPSSIEREKPIQNIQQNRTNINQNKNNRQKQSNGRNRNNRQKPKNPEQNLVDLANK